MTDFLEEKRKEIQARLKELKPLVDEYRRLEAAERALAGVEPSPPLGHGRAPRHAPHRSSNGRRGRPKGSGTRRCRRSSSCARGRASRIPELAEAMGIKQNYLYRVMPTLAERGTGREVGPRLALTRQRR